MFANRPSRDAKSSVGTFNLLILSGPLKRILKVAPSLIFKLLPYSQLCFSLGPPSLPISTLCPEGDTSTNFLNFYWFVFLWVRFQYTLRKPWSREPPISISEPLRIQPSLPYQANKWSYLLNSCGSRNISFLLFFLFPPEQRFSTCGSWPLGKHAYLIVLETETQLSTKITVAAKLIYGAGHHSMRDAALKRWRTTALEKKSKEKM